MINNKTEDYVVLRKYGIPFFLEYNSETNKVISVSDNFINRFLGKHIDEIKKTIEENSKVFYAIMTESDYHKKQNERIMLYNKRIKLLNNISSKSNKIIHEKLKYVKRVSGSERFYFDSVTKEQFFKLVDRSSSHEIFSNQEIVILQFNIDSEYCGILINFIKLGESLFCIKYLNSK